MEATRAQDAGNRDYTDFELEFAVFCIESLAERLGQNPAETYDMLARRSDILDSYIVPCCDALHTQDKEYIVDDILDVIRERGIAV